MRNDENPPGMWVGFYARLPKCDAYAPRMGMIGGMELHVPDGAYYDTIDEARAAGRIAAWARYKAWQREAPEKTMSIYLRDQALSGMEMRTLVD